MNKVHFLLGVHNHQPIGNFDFVFEKAYQQAYLPFLEAMERHPRLHWNLHATGILWEWLEKHHPEYVDRIAAQVRQGQLEILTGGFYEPILPALSDRDKLGQIQKLTRYIKGRFKTRAKGMWLAERVWEPHLTKILAQAGVEYTLLDDTHFLTTGMTDDEMTGSYLTEEQGAVLRVLPIRKDLRYAIPFKDPGETLNLLRCYATASAHKALVMFDDGEKFGLWPDTFDHVYTRGWLESFLTVLESNADWIYCSRVSDYLAHNPPQGRVYLPTSSYEEMGRWALPTSGQQALEEVVQRQPAGEGDSLKRMLRGGFWRNFLTKYEESNNLHKKMLHVADKVHKAAAVLDGSESKPSGKTQKMLDALWAGQCNCAYWHGVFGGLYLPHLRQALYKHLLMAETLADKVLNKGTDVVEEDFDKDGRSEILIETPDQNVYIAPEAGGSIFEWDLRAPGINLLNVLTRRAEGYHEQLQAHARALKILHASASEEQTVSDGVRVKEAALETRLFVDWHRRTSLLDHFLHADTTLDDFYRSQFGEQGDFVKSGYRADVIKGSYPQVHLTRTGSVWNGDQRNSISIEKTISLTGALGWQVIYRIENTQGAACQLWFASEMAFAFTSQNLMDPVEHLAQQTWQRRDPGMGFMVKAQFDAPTNLWEFPLQTVSLSEEGFERTYQGTVLVAHERISLNPGQVLVRSWRVSADS